MKMYVGIDLHSNNNYVAILDEELETVVCRRLRNDLNQVLKFLEPYREDIVAIAVESTFNWYWLVDGLVEAGYDLRLVNTTKATNYSGKKYTDDKHDARWIAHMLALGILPEGYITPPEVRGVRDLLRRRLFLVQKRTSFLLSTKTIYSRSTGRSISTDDIPRLDQQTVRVLIDDEPVAESIEVMLPVIKVINREIATIERRACARVKDTEDFTGLQTIPGVGLVLSMTIMLETADIGRFKSVGNFSSYCRCVKSERRSNDKKKGQGNRKNGNKYLSWAFSEAAHHITRYEPLAKRYYDRKRARCHPMVARRALANKLTKASFFIMRDPVAFDAKRLFN